MTKAQIIKRLALLNIPVYEVDPKVRVVCRTLCFAASSVGPSHPLSMVSAACPTFSLLA